MVREKFKYNQGSVDAGGEKCPHCLITFYLKNNSELFYKFDWDRGQQLEITSNKKSVKRVSVKYKSYYNLIYKISVLKKLS